MALNSVPTHKSMHHGIQISKLLPHTKTKQTRIAFPELLIFTQLFDIANDTAMHTLLLLTKLLPSKMQPQRQGVSGATHVHDEYIMHAFDDVHRSYGKEE